MIEFKLTSKVTAEELLQAAQKLTSMAHGLGVKIEVPKQAETTAPVDVPDSTDTCPSNTTTTVAEETTATGVSGLDFTNLDKEGAPWDEEIHAATKTQTAKGIWKKARGLDEEIYKAKNAKNIAAAKVHFENALGSGDPAHYEDPAEVFNDSAEVEDPEEVFGTKERPDFMGDAPVQAEVQAEVQSEEAAPSQLPATPKELMDRSIAHLSQGNLTLDEISGVLKQNPNVAGEVAPHLGALAAGEKFAGQVPAIAQAMNNILMMKGLSL